MRGSLSLWAWVLPLLLVLAPCNAGANNTRPDIEAQYIGSKSITVGGSWGDVRSDDLVCATTGAACSASLLWARLVVVNTSAATIYIELKANAGESTTNAIAVDAGDTIELPLYGLSVRTVSLRASVGGAGVRVVGFFFTN